MSAEDQSASSTPTGPSWTELTEFIQNQTQNDRELIDRWFRLAVGILSFLLLVIVSVAGFFGWSSYQAIRTIAERTANEVATEQVKQLMEDPRIQQLALDTATKLFQQGAYQKAVEQAVHSQMQTAIQKGVLGEYTIAINGVPNQNMRIEKKLPETRKK